MNDMSRVELGTREMEVSPTARDINRAADATSLGRLKNLVPDKARHAIRLSMQKTAVTASGLFLLVSSGCGNIANPLPLSPEPTNDGVKVTVTRAHPTPEPDTEGVTVTIIPAQTHGPEPSPARPIASSPEPTPEASKAEKIQKEYRSLPLPEEKNINFEKMEFEEIEKILLRFRGSYKGERLNYEDVLLRSNFDAYIIGENHFPYMGQYENTANLIKIGVRPTVVGLEFVDEHSVEGKEFVKKFNSGNISLSDAALNNYRYRNESKPFLSILREKKFRLQGSSLWKENQIELKEVLIDSKALLIGQ